MATRNYAAEYKAYGGTPQQIKNRAARNAARAVMEKKGLVRKGDNLDVDHKHPIVKGGTNAVSNLRAVPASQNRSFARTKSSGMK